MISKGTVLSDRFVVESFANEGDMGQVYRALDQKTGQPVALRVVPLSILRRDDIDHIKARMQQACALQHKNIRSTFGMGMTEEYLFIAAEWVDGYNLQTQLQKREGDHKRFSFKGAYNIIGHVCNALAHAHDAGTYHGSLNPRAILINRAGRVKVHDWALSTVRIAKPDYAGRGSTESSFWAPEVLKNPREATTRSDIFSLGAIFYVLITGRTPERPLRAPSKLGFSPEVDNVIARCMSADPRQRFMSAKEVKQAISQLAKSETAGNDAAESAGTSTAVDDSLGIDIDIEFDPSATQDVVPVQPPAGGMLNAPGLPPPPSAPKPLGVEMDGRASIIDMGAVLANTAQSEAARWMVQKDKFDHGPFSDRELIQMILRGEVIGNHKLANMDTGVRKKVRAWGDFDEYLERYRIKKKEMEEQAALVRAEKAETRGLFFKVVVALGVLGVIGLAVGGYFLSRKLREEKQLGPQEMVDAFDSGEIQIKMGGGTLDGQKGRGRRGGRRGGRGGGGGSVDGGMSYEDAMNTAMSMGDLSGAGGRALTAEDINAIMSRNVRKFLPCIAGESVTRVDIDIAVDGEGRVMGASARQGSEKMKSCVVRTTRSIKFPPSNQPRTATTWYFELY